jgi:hypothetical protein
MRAAQPDEACDMRPVRIPLSVNDPNAGRSLTRSVDRLLRDGRARAPVVVELHGSHLPAAIVAALIGNLRRLREVGGALAVNAGSPALRSAIALHGLDRVLDRSFGVARDARRARRRRSVLHDTAWPAIALLILTVTVATVAILFETAPGYGGI